MKNRVRKDRDAIDLWLMAYGFGFTFFAIMPTFLPGWFSPPLTLGDAFDFLTPLAVIFLAWALFGAVERAESSPVMWPRLSGTPAKMAVFVGSILYVEGHGLHLAANSLARLVKDMTDTEIGRAVYLFDEIISHFVWDGGVFLISVGLILAGLKLERFHMLKAGRFVVISGAFFYGFTFAGNGIEGQTVPFTFPAAGIGFTASFLLFLRRYREGCINPVHLFFMIGYLVSLILFSYWGLRYGGAFPEFSALGWI